jgi:hypothetical protein
MKYIITESQLKKIIDSEIDERSRTLSNTRKKRIFPKSAMMSNPDRFKEYDKEVRDVKEDISSEEQELDSLLMSVGIVLTPEEKSEIQPECQQFEIPPQVSSIVDSIKQKLDGMNKVGLINTLKQVLSIQKKTKSPQPTQEQLAPVIIAGVSVPGVAVAVVVGLIALIIVVKIARLIKEGKRHYNRLGQPVTTCKRRRKLVRKFGIDGNFM